MIVHAVVAPLVPEIGLGVVLIGALCAFVVAWALHDIWKATFGAFFNWLGNLGIAINKSILHINVHPFRFLLDFNRQVEQALSAMLAHTERAVVKTLNLMRGVATDTGLTIASLAERAYHALLHQSHTARVVVPNAIRRGMVQPLRRQVEAALGRLNARATHIARSLDAQAARIAARTQALAHSVAGTFPRIRDLERDAQAAKKWLRRHRYLAGYGSLAALGVAILSRLRLGWLRCNNVGKFNKRVCGANPSWLDDFFAGMILIAGTTSFVEFVKEAQQGYDLGLEGLQVIIRELKD